jgi:hypothetical protein
VLRHSCLFIYLTMFSALQIWMYFGIEWQVERGVGNDVEGSSLGPSWSTVPPLPGGTEWNHEKSWDDRSPCQNLIPEPLEANRKCKPLDCNLTLLNECAVVLLMCGTCWDELWIRDVLRINDYDMLSGQPLHAICSYVRFKWAQNGST